MKAFQSLQLAPAEESELLPFGPLDSPRKDQITRPALQRLADMANAAKAAKYPGLRPKYLNIWYSDDDRHNLTRAIVDYLNLSGCWGYRTDLNRYFDRQEPAQLPDILGIRAGRTVAIGIEIGEDLLSDEQRETMADLERAGVKCFIAQDFQGFSNWFECEFQAEPLL